MKKPQVLIILLITSLIVSCASHRIPSERISRILDNAPAFQQGFTGLVIYDPHKEKIVYSKNGNKYFTPASNTKLLTFYTGLKIIKDSIPALQYLIRGDSLIFKGTGDPSLLYKDYNSQKLVRFLKHADKKLFLQQPNLIEEKLGPGWAWDDYNYNFSAERSPLPIYGNLVRFESMAEHWHIHPEIFSDSISADKADIGTSIKRRESANIFEIKSPGTTEKFTRSVPFITSTAATAVLLSDTLKRKVSVLPKDFTPNYLDQTIFSVDAHSLYREMLQESDNFIAEQLLLVSAGILSDTLKTDIAINYAKKNYLDDLPDEPFWYDGSGLSRYNLITPRSMVVLIKKISDEVGIEKLKSLLPANGVSGTLKQSYPSVSPFIYAKTGTLKNNYSLSGILVTDQGKPLYFSFMNSNFIEPKSALEQAMGYILETIHNHY